MWLLHFKTSLPRCFTSSATLFALLKYNKCYSEVCTSEAGLPSNLLTIGKAILLSWGRNIRPTTLTRTASKIWDLQASMYCLPSIVLVITDNSLKLQGGGWGYQTWLVSNNGQIRPSNTQQRANITTNT